MKYKICACPRCNNLTTSRYCEKHKDMEKQKGFFTGQRKKSAAYNNLYHTQRWRRERLDFLKEYPVCMYCGRKAEMVDHIRPHKGDEELFWNHNNWQPLCYSCHTKKTLAENNYFRQNDENRGF